MHKTNSTLELVKKARTLIEDKKGTDIIVYDVSRISGVTDYYLIASGTSTPHLGAISESIVTEFKKSGIQCSHKAGNMESGWLVIDYLNMVIHLFRPDVRTYYSIEELWAKAPRVN